MNLWHYEKNGERHGPVSDMDIRTLVSNRSINGSTLVWQQGFADWEPLSGTTLVTFMQDVSAPPVLPGSKINNGIVWLLAFAPLIGLFLQGFIAGLINGYELGSLRFDRYWWVTIVLNIALSTFDLRQLKKTGADTKHIDRFAVLVPVYLWKRAKTLGQQPLYFWVWLAAFVASIFLD